MIGKGLIKLIGYILAGAIALAAGAELLASVVSVVISFRDGNYFPFLTAIAIPILLLRIMQRQTEGTPIRIVLNIAAYAATGYVVVIAFVIALPYGLVASVVASVIASIGISVLGDPSGLVNQIQEIVPGAMLGARLDGISRRMIPIGNGSSFALNRVHSLHLVDHSESQKIVQLMRDRPVLPISLTHFEESDVLFITTEDQSLVDRILILLAEVGIRTNGSPPPLLAEALQMIPIIDENNGLSMKSYKLAKDEKAVADLLNLWPLRMTVFPSIQGVMILVPDSASTGLAVEEMETGHASDILLNRNYSTLREVRETVESSA